MLGRKEVREAEAEGAWKGGHFILTYTGRVFNYDDIDFDSIDIVDIAHALSQLCRYTGQTRMFYSVAQHSMLVAEKMPGGPEEKLVGLLHDAAEAYTNDLSSPLKKYLRRPEDDWEGAITDVYGYLQDRITAVIYGKYGIARIPSDVKLYDRAALVFEAEGFMGLDGAELQKYHFPVELRGLWHPWEPLVYAGTSVDKEMGQVETEFLVRFEALMKACGREGLV